MLIGPMTKVTIYQHINYGGSSNTFKTTSNTLRQSFECDWWDRTISSIRVERN